MANSRPGAYNNETRTHASPTEHTPLLPAPRRTDSTDTVYTNANSQDGNSDASSITTVDDHNNEILALLYKVNSNVSALGLEPEVLPKAGVVGGHGDYGTGKDGELLRTGLDDDLEASGKTQLIGVTQGQFWLIFSGMRNPQ